MNSLAPVVLFVYNRPEHTARTIQALKANTLAIRSDLIIYADAARDASEAIKVEEVLTLVSSISGFKSITIIKQEKNMGLANSIISGVSEVCAKYGRVIVLEDDLITSPIFLEFMNKSLDFYKCETKIFTISGYSDINIPSSYEGNVYFSHISTSWGWATWNDRWSTVTWDDGYYENLLKNKVLMNEICKKVGNARIKMLKMQVNGQINSWAIRRLFSQLIQKKYTIFPRQTLINNIGHDGSGVHCGKDSKYDKGNMLSTINLFEKLPFKEDVLINKLIYKKNHDTFRSRVVRKLKLIFKS